MSLSSRDAYAPDLREFIKENDEGLYVFSYLMLNGDNSNVEELLLKVSREFGVSYRKLLRHKTSTWEPLYWKIKLFHLAWEKIRSWSNYRSLPWQGLRDSKHFKSFDENLLDVRNIVDHSVDKVLDRLVQVDFEFRAPLILRDVLHFEDEEVSRILDLRWGVYRHRLHRGRLEFRDALKGWPRSEEAKPLNVTL